MRPFPSSTDVQGATYYYYPGHWIQFQDRTTPKGAFLALQAATVHTQHILHILPSTHLYTWVESSNVDKVSCSRTKVPGIDGNRTRNPLIQSQGFNPIYHGTSTFVCYKNIAKTGNLGIIHEIFCVLQSISKQTLIVGERVWRRNESS